MSKTGAEGKGKSTERVDSEQALAPNVFFLYMLMLLKQTCVLPLSAHYRAQNVYQVGYT